MHSPSVLTAAQRSPQSVADRPTDPIDSAHGALSVGPSGFDFRWRLSILSDKPRRSCGMKTVRTTAVISNTYQCEYSRVRTSASTYVPVRVREDGFGDMAQPLWQAQHAHRLCLHHGCRVACNSTCDVETQSMQHTKCKMQRCCACSGAGPVSLEAGTSETESLANDERCDDGARNL